MVLNTLLPFCLIYLCKVALSALTIIKQKYWSTLKSLDDYPHPLVLNIQPGCNPFFCTSVCIHMYGTFKPMEGRGRLCGLFLPFPLCNCQGWNSASWACTENPLSTELSCKAQDLTFYLKKSTRVPSLFIYKSAFIFNKWWYACKTMF